MSKMQGTWILLPTGAVIKLQQSPSLIIIIIFTTFVFNYNSICFVKILSKVLLVIFFHVILDFLMKKFASQTLQYFVSFV